jgi:hypothetical protein
MTVGQMGSTIKADIPVKIMNKAAMPISTRKETFLPYRVITASIIPGRDFLKAHGHFPILV